jgi:hypothetical protein
MAGQGYLPDRMRERIALVGRDGLADAVANLEDNPCRAAAAAERQHRRVGEVEGLDSEISNIS